MVISRNFFNLDIISKITYINIPKGVVLFNVYIIYKQTSKKGRYISSFYVPPSRYKSREFKLKNIRKIILEDKKVKVPVRTRYNYRRL